MDIGGFLSYLLSISSVLFDIFYLVCYTLACRTKLNLASRARVRVCIRTFMESGILHYYIHEKQSSDIDSQFFRR